MISDEAISRLIDNGLIHALYVDMRIIHKDLVSVSFENGKNTGKECSKEYGASIRVFTKNGIGYSSVSQISEATLEEGIKKAVKIAQLTRKKVSSFTVGRNVKTLDWTHKLHPDPDEVISTVYEFVKSCDVPVIDADITEVLLCATSATHQAVYTSEGSCIKSVVPHTLLTSTSHLSSGKKMAFLIKESAGAAKMLHEIDNKIPDLIERVHEKVKTAYNAKKGILERSPADVVLDSNAAGMILHEAIGHSLEADAIVEGKSPFISDIERKVAPDIVTIIDDATTEEHFGSYPVDADGIMAEKKVLIRNGILKKYLVDLECSIDLGLPPNGCGRVGGFSGFPIPRSSNISIEGGNWNNEEILEESQGCIYIRTPSTAQISPDMTSFFIESYDAYILNKGSPDIIKNGIRVFFDTRSVLNKITALGDSVIFHPTVCVKERQMVPVSVGAPYMRLSNVQYLSSG
ncbi:MAG: TldD/PmbA family protein [Theionarchaea archaeon]|nr:TldD/PmbA family protein [Theionarchaea archaeon]